MCVFFLIRNRRLIKMRSWWIKIECQVCLAVDGDARYGRCAAAQKAVADASPDFVLPRRSVHAPLRASVFTPESPCFDFLSLFRDEIVRLAPF